ncbi:MAG: DUF551 domain-containing protein [Clostridium sp.]|nr:DUF551 domain-containing protein [Clostridium sp.]
MYEELVCALKKCGYPGDVHFCRDCVFTNDGGTCHREKLLPAAADAIEELSKPHWIPVTERLPEKEQCCLVVLNNRTVDFCFYTKRCGFGMYLARKWEGANDEVTHWMPLPVPPKEET